MPDARPAAFHAAAAREFDAVAEHVGLVERDVGIAGRRIATRFAGRELAGALTSALAADPAAGGTGIHATIAGWEAGSCPGEPITYPWREEDIGPGGLVRGSGPGDVIAVHETYSGAVTAARGPSLLHRVPRLDAQPRRPLAESCAALLPRPLRERACGHAGA